jgi:hypothetical protein
MDADDHKSTSGYNIFINDNLVSWRSVKQKTTALSTAEAEIDAATECVKEMRRDTIQIRNSQRYRLALP